MQIGTKGKPQARVVASHTIARRAMITAGVFMAAAVVWAVVTLVSERTWWWGPLHAFLAGGVLLAISGASQMFTITWATATPPPAWMSISQRWLVTVGTACVLVGFPNGWVPLLWVGAAGVVAGLVLLAVSIAGTVRRSLLRRFDLSARFYVLAFTSGVLGVTVGGWIGSGAAAGAFAHLRLVHIHLNLVGLVGLTIIGTLPTFLPTVSHHRAVSGREAMAAWWVAVAAVVCFAAGVVAPARILGVGSLLIAAAGTLITTGIVVRLPAKARRKASYQQLVLGMVWLVVWAVVDAIGLFAGTPLVPFAAWTMAAVVAGVGQILFGSLAYIVPVLRGPPTARASRVMARWSWIQVASVNLAGIGLVAGVSVLAVAAGTVWVVDFAVRMGLIVARPPAP